MDGESLRRSTLALVALTWAFVGCARPNPVFGDSEGGTAGGSSGGESSRGEGSLGTTMTGGMSSATADATETTQTAESGSESDPGARCGDGIAEEDEECDEDDANAWEARCQPDCTLNECGDGYVAPGQPCDDANDVPYDGCDQCVLTSCGNGKTEDDEECDTGPGGDFRCTPFCTHVICGDDDVSPDEECDDGNDDDNDGCSADCALEICGDGVVQDAEACDGDPKSGPQCTADNGELIPLSCSFDCTSFVPVALCCMGEGAPCIVEIPCCGPLVCNDDDICSEL